MTKIFRSDAMKLYELTAQVKGLQRLMEDGEMDEQTLRDTLEGLLEGDLPVKADSLMAYVANLGAESDAYRAEIKRMQAHVDANDRKQESLREYLRYNMDTSGIDKISCRFFTITLRAAPPIVVIESEDLIPAMYKETVETVKISKEAIKRHLKEGIHVPGARLGDGKRGLVIK